MQELIPLAKEDVNRCVIYVGVYLHRYNHNRIMGPVILASGVLLKSLHDSRHSEIVGCTHGGGITFILSYFLKDCPCRGISANWTPTTFKGNWF